VLAERTAAVWTARAQAVTVRRLVAEVEWSLDQWNANAARAVPPGPPPAGTISHRTSPMPNAKCVRVGNGVRSMRRSHAGPVSIVALVQAAVAAFRRPGEPRWAGFESE